MNEYPKKIQITVYLENGEIIRGMPITINDAHEDANWGKILRNPKGITYLALNEVNAFGDEDSIFINPNFITHIRVTTIQE